MIILGINAFHGDSSAVILRDGQLIAAVEEERFRRLKHWAGFPVESIRYCLQAASVTIADVDHVAINQDTGANLSKKISYTLAHRPDFRLVMDRIRNKRKRRGTLELLEAEFPGQTIKAKLHSVEHHVAHLSSAFHCSPFDKASVVSVDGFGDFASAAWGRGQGSEIEVEGRVYFPHSLGVFYQALTQFLGFPNYGDEYKVMGLASYGQPVYLEKMREIVQLQMGGTFTLNLGYFIHHKEKIDYTWEGGHPSVGTMYSDKLCELLGTVRRPDEPIEQKHMDMAHSIQAMYQEAFFHLLDSLYQRHHLDTVAIAGGCGMNSVANGRIRTFTRFKKTYVQAAAGDAGGALGAAYSVWHELGNTTRVPMTHALHGPEYSDDDHQEVLKEHDEQLDPGSFSVTRAENDEELCDVVTRAITAGGVIGWFQGRMEWGPRALGNRSILCDPGRLDMKDILNSKIKRRESFRPFAPSVLREYVSEWFEEDDDVPFMMKVFFIRKEQREKIPSVCHVDGTGRLQTIHKETNPLYWQLINTFRLRTGIPMLLNTSFNENEPIVCTPKEAMACFLRTNMDLLVLGHWVVKRL